jgi:predicted transcriptional regulator
MLRAYASSRSLRPPVLNPRPQETRLSGSTPAPMVSRSRLHCLPVSSRPARFIVNCPCRALALPSCYRETIEGCMTATITLKLPEKLKTRIAHLAKVKQRSAHSVMIEALEREVAREERMREFVRGALAADAAIEAGAAVYRAGGTARARDFLRQDRPRRSLPFPAGPRSNSHPCDMAPART